MKKDSKGLERAREMAKWRDRRGGVRPGEGEAPSALGELLAEWCADQARRALSARTIETRRGHGRRFLRWCRGREVEAPGWISAGLIEEWLAHLAGRTTAQGTPLKESTREGVVRAVRSFLGFLVERRVLKVNPLTDYRIRRGRRMRLPTVLDEAAVAAVLAVPDTTDALGVRDRAILELLYSSGLRRAECAQIELQDLRTRTGILTVRRGKGGRQRVVPVGRVALHWVRRYLEEVRPQLEVPARPSDYLFLTGYGDRFSFASLGQLVKRYLKRAGITHDGSCHLFRHACATHLLDHGADLRTIQTLLGHSRLAATEIYTHVTTERMCEVHHRAHPRG